VNKKREQMSKQEQLTLIRLVEQRKSAGKLTYTFVSKKREQNSKNPVALAARSQFSVRCS
jgi:hypothetical protein